MSPAPSDFTRERKRVHTERQEQTMEDQSASQIINTQSERHTQNILRSNEVNQLKKQHLTIHFPK